MATYARANWNLEKAIALPVVCLLAGGVGYHFGGDWGSAGGVGFGLCFGTWAGFSNGPSSRVAFGIGWLLKWPVLLLMQF